jgi:hypothetical protein
MTESILSHVVKCTTSRDAWLTLERLFTSHSRARTMQVHYQLATLKKGNTSVADYFQKFTSLTDTLAAVNQTLNDFEATSFLLAGLGTDYDSFVTSATTRVEPLTIEEIYGHLLAHEQRIQHQLSSLDVSLAGANFAAKGKPPRGGRGTRLSSGRSFTGRGYAHSPLLRGRRRTTGFSSSSRPVCQVCNKPGHIALDCYQRFNPNLQRDSPSNSQAFMASPQALADQTWYPDSGASHHITSDLANLNLKAEEYTGSDQLRVGNGTGLSIHRIGNAHLFTPTLPFTLYNVLHVPHITKNLLSIHQFTKATNTYLEFHPFHFLVEDRATGKPLLRGRCNHGLYSFLSLSASNNFSQPAAMVGERTSVSGWHCRLGHPTFRVLQPLLSKFQLPFYSNKESPACAACFSSKSHQQFYSHSHTRSLGPLDLVYTDVWGSSPVCSASGFKYYVAFSDCL